MMTFEDYFTRLFTLRAEFDLAKRAVDGWAGSQEALDHYAKDELENLREMFLKAEKGDAWVFADEAGINAFVGSIKQGAPEKVAGVKARLTQHEYILCVTVFESFMKEIHREILRTDPTLLRPKRQLELQELIALGQEALINKEIEMEVDRIDRESTRERASYFRRLGINWFDGTAVPVLEAALELRNVILHEDPDRPVTKTDETALLIICTGIPFATICGAAILYPQSFPLPEGITEKAARMFFLDPKLKH